MLPRSQRIQGSDFLEKIKRRGLRKSSPFFGFTYLPADKPQFAVVVSTRFDKRAIARNLIRRRTYEALKNNLSLAKKSVSAIITLRSYRKLEQLTYEEIEKQIKQFLKNL